MVSSTGGGGSGAGHGGDYGSGGGGGGGEGGDHAGKNRTGAMLALAEIGRSLDSIPSDLAAAIQAGRIPCSIVQRFTELEKSGFLRWFLQFGGFKERLLADELFLSKVFMECGVGVFAKVGFFVFLLCLFLRSNAAAQVLMLNAETVGFDVM